jgi:hypothetical protein
MLKRLTSTVRSLGWSDTLSYIAAVLIARASFGKARLIKYYFVAQPVPAAPAGPPRSPGSLQIYVTTEPDAVLGQAPRPPEVIRQRFEQQRAECVVAKRDGELAGCIWVCPRRYVEDEVRCVYRWAPEGEAMWDFDVYIAPPWRMSRVFARLWEHAHAHLRAGGVRWTLSRIDAFNAGSLTAHRKLGAQDLARAWFLVAGPLQLTIMSMAPFVHLTLRRDGGPDLRFDVPAHASSVKSVATESG